MALCHKLASPKGDRTLQTKASLILCEKRLGFVQTRLPMPLDKAKWLL